MHTTISLLDALKAAHALPSDYAAAKVLGVTHQAVSKYRTKRSFFEEKVCLRVADLLDLNPLQVVACTHVERAEKLGDETLKAFWSQYAGKMPKYDNLSYPQKSLKPAPDKACSLAAAV